MREVCGGYLDRPANPAWEAVFNQTLYRDALDADVPLDAYVAVHCAFVDGLELELARGLAAPTPREPVARAAARALPSPTSDRHARVRLAVPAAPRAARMDAAANASERRAIGPPYRDRSSSPAITAPTLARGSMHAADDRRRRPRRRGRPRRVDAGRRGGARLPRTWRAQPRAPGRARHDAADAAPHPARRTADTRWSSSPHLLLSGLSTGSVYALVALGFNVDLQEHRRDQFRAGRVGDDGRHGGGDGRTRAKLPLALALLVGAGLVVRASALLSERLVVRRLQRPDAADRHAGDDRHRDLHQEPRHADAGQEPGVGCRAFPATRRSQWLGGCASSRRRCGSSASTRAVMVGDAFVLRTHACSGKALRAAAAQPEAAALVRRRARAWRWRCRSRSRPASARIAGVIITPLTLTSFDHGTVLGFKGFRRRCSAGWAACRARWSAGCVLGLLEALAGGTDLVAFQGRGGVRACCCSCCSCGRPGCSGRGAGGAGLSAQAASALHTRRCAHRRLARGCARLASSGCVCRVAIRRRPTTTCSASASCFFINLLLIGGLNLVMGYGGQISLCHGGFFGLGAYVSRRAVGPLRRAAVRSAWSPPCARRRARRGR